MRREEFLLLVEKYIEEDPEAAAYVSDHVQIGLRSALTEARQRAADMEAALCIATAKRHKNKDDFIRQKVQKWKDKSSMAWSWMDSV